MCAVPEEEKGVVCPELEFPMAVSHYVGAENQTQALSQSNKCSKPLGTPFPSPPQL